MTLGLIVLLAVIGVAQLAVLAGGHWLRRRRRAEALEAADRLLMERIHRDLLPGPLMTFGGIPVVTSRYLPPGVQGIVMARPPTLAGDSPTLWSAQEGNIRDDLERARLLVREIQRIETLVMRPDSLVKITGI